MTISIVAPNSDEYEYIVVGSGAGGGPLAARLALSGKKTLLIEAGEDQGKNLNQTLPVFHAYSTEDPSMSWDFYVKHYADEERAKTDSKMAWETPSKGVYVGKNPPAGSKQKGILYPRSGTLGGCTTHNAMVAVYPHASDWSYIVNITGDASWEPAKMRKLFERLEASENFPKGTAGHGTEGYLGTSTPPVALANSDETLLTVGVTSANVISKDPLEEAENLQRVFGGDMNSADATRDKQEGIWLIPLSIKKDGVVGKRSGSRDIIMQVYNAKTESGAKKYPLDIALNTFATKVLFAPAAPGAKPKATGVEILKGQYLYKASPRSSNASPGPVSTVKATKEVILAGGAYNSPQLLKLSGIGPKEELEKFKIPVVVNSPGVGTNLQDHFEIGTTSEQPDGFAVVDTCTFNTHGGADPCLDKWNKGEGVYGASNGFIFGVIKKSSVAHLDPVYGNDPDLFLFGGIAAFRGYYPGYSSDVYRHKNWTWVVLKAHSNNRAGTVKLRSANPLDVPEITFNYFDTGDKEAGARDVTAMSEAVELARKITNKVVLPKAPTTQIFKESLPGPSIASNSTAMADHIKAESWSHHASCTCAIGADNDPKAVLDSKFRVRGVEGLRVVDASVFPRIPGYFVAVPIVSTQEFLTHTMGEADILSQYMIAEKAADSILTGV
jgi:choline dehydrogenase